MTLGELFAKARGLQHIDEKHQLVRLLNFLNFNLINFF